MVEGRIHIYIWTQIRKEAAYEADLRLISGKNLGRNLVKNLSLFCSRFFVLMAAEVLLNILSKKILDGFLLFNFKHQVIMFFITDRNQSFAYFLSFVCIFLVTS